MRPLVYSLNRENRKIEGRDKEKRANLKMLLSQFNNKLVLDLKNRKTNQKISRIKMAI